MQPMGQGRINAWGYSRKDKRFALVNRYDQSAYTFKFPGTAAEAGDAGVRNRHASGIQISPNPVRTRAVVGAGAAVYDLRGALVARAGHDGVWDARDAAPGVYAVKAFIGGKEISKRLVVAK